MTPTLRERWESDPLAKNQWRQFIASDCWKHLVLMLREEAESDVRVIRQEADADAVLARRLIHFNGILSAFDRLQAAAETKKLPDPEDDPDIKYAQVERKVYQ